MFKKIFSSIREEPAPAAPPFLELRTKRPVLLISFIGGLLALTSGYLNAICLLLWERSVTHVSGLVTRTSTYLIKDSVTKFLYNGLQVICFLVGATTSSLMVGAHRKFIGGRQYSLVLFVIGVIVLLVAVFDLQNEFACYILTFVSGMQNAMTTFYSGAVVRTTHVTGTVTDIGIEIAKLMKGSAEGWWKIQVLTCFFFGFFAGGILGAVASTLPTSTSLLFPAFIFMGLSLGNWLYHEKWWNQMFSDKVGPEPVVDIHQKDPPKEVIECEV